MRDHRLLGATALAAGLVLCCGLPIRACQAAEEELSIAFATPKIQAGAVRWHGTFEKACQAAKKSHKPVFLFQLVGFLDEELC